MVLVASKAGDQVPKTPLSDVVGNGDSVSPMHIGSTNGKVGTTAAIMVKSSVSAAAGLVAIFKFFKEIYLFVDVVVKTILVKGVVEK